MSQSAFQARTQKPYQVTHTIAKGVWGHRATRIALVMNNAAYHRSAPSLAALSLFEPRVLVIWLPTYCSELNPIERYWRHLKDRACANKLQDSIGEVVKSAENTMRDQNSIETLSCYHVSRNLRRFAYFNIMTCYNQ
ncbi:MAG: transposase [Chloroflexota bacterium]